MIKDGKVIPKEEIVMHFDANTRKERIEDNHKTIIIIANQNAAFEACASQ